MYAWYIEVCLTMVCLASLIAWASWLITRLSCWSSRLTMMLIKIGSAATLSGFAYCVLAVPAIRRELLAGEFDNPHLMSFLLVCCWASCTILLVRSMALYRMARRAEASGRHSNLFRSIIVISLVGAPVWAGGLAQLYYLGHWGSTELLVVGVGGVAILALVGLSMHLMLEPMITGHFACREEETSLQTKTVVIPAVALLSSVVCAVMMVIGNRDETPAVMIGMLVGMFVLLAVPCLGLSRGLLGSLTDTLKEVAEQIQSSRKPTEIHVSTCAELVAVAESYNDLVRRLGEYHDMLEDQVDERTAELVQANETLRLEMAERDRGREELKRSRDAAQAATSAKSEFLANMSHEIRTPMTAILGFTEVLREQEAVSASDECSDAVNTIMRNGEYLLGIINDILDLSKIEAGKLEVQRGRCSPKQVVSEVISLIQVQASARVVVLEDQYVGAIPETIETDAVRLRQILINLVGNAVKFSERGKVRVISRLVAGSNGPVMEFSVVDNGIGMTAEQIEEVFKPFSQASASTSKRFGGTGLGLTISKHLAEMLGGDITVTSSEGKGSTFCVTVAAGSLDGVTMVDHSTASEPKETAASIECLGEPGKLDCRLLVAEDGLDNQRLIVFILAKAGATVAVAGNGRSAVDKVIAGREEGKPFDVVLMDMQMPIMNGYEATRLLRQKGYRGKIISLTAHAMEGDREKCLRVGCDDYVTKPINRRGLIDTIRKHVLAAGGASKVETSSGDSAEKGVSDEADMGALTEAFVSELSQRLSDMERAVKAKELEDVGKLAHQLKGAAGGYGFDSIGRAAGLLEAAAAGTYEVERLERLLEELAGQCRLVQDGRLSEGMRTG